VQVAARPRRVVRPGETIAHRPLPRLEGTARRPPRSAIDFRRGVSRIVGFDAWGRHPTCPQTAWT